MTHQLNTIRIATRKSELAMWQANYVRDRLLNQYPHLHIEIMPMITSGDKLSQFGNAANLDLAQESTKGLFVKELELALLERRADIAVHSIKDMPAILPNNLGLHCVCEREDPRDAFIANNYPNINSMPDNAIIGTSSLRRSAQIKHHYPHLLIKQLRGNVNTRLAKLDAGEYDAIILAAAGLKRLQMHNRITDYLNTDICLNAPAQGAVGVECLNSNQQLIDLLKPLNHFTTYLAITAERALNRQLNGGCRAPIAAYASFEESNNNQILKMQALVADPDGKQIIKTQQQILISKDFDKATESATKLGENVATELINQRATKFL